MSDIYTPIIIVGAGSSHQIEAIKQAFHAMEMKAHTILIMPADATLKITDMSTGLECKITDQLIKEVTI